MAGVFPNSIIEKQLNAVKTGFLSADMTGKIAYEHLKLGKTGF